MRKQPCLETIQNLIHQKIPDYDKQRINANTLLKEIWIQMNSMQMITFVVELETEFGLELPDELVGNMTGSHLTLGDLADLIKSHQERL
ncbi:acyl carrier protein [Paenibacillus pabuli]|uniref:acyl carrier protein n=1 Tax=Paenibacillus pabuli TaxID=1472 RepID=UPI003CF1565E